MKQRNRKWKTTAFISLILILITGQSWAISLSFAPSASQIMVGDSVDIDIMISGLEEIDIGDFDVTVGFDDSILDFDGYALGNGLDDLLWGPGLDMSNGLQGSDRIHLAELSLTFGPYPSQLNFFSLGTLSFTAQNAGISDLSFLNVILSDGNWTPGELTATLSTGSVEVASVPEPASLLLFATGLAGLAGLRRKKRK